MKRFTEYLSGCAALLFQVALTGWMFALSEINFDFISMELNYVLLSALLLAAYFLNLIALRRGISVPLFAGLQALVLAAAIFAFVKTVHIEPFTLRTVIINCIVYCLGFAVAAYIAWTPTNQTGVLLRFDALVVMAVIMMVLDKVIVIPGAHGCLNMCWFALCICLLAAVSLKSGALLGRGSAVEGSGALGRILLFAIAGLVALAALLVIIFAAGEVKSFSEFLLNIIRLSLNALKTAFLWLYGLLERFMLWLSRFFDDTPMESIGGMPVGDMGGATEKVDAGSLPPWLWAIPIALLLAAVAYLVFRLRKYRTVKITVSRNVVTKVKRESGLRKALKELWDKIKTELLFRKNCLSRRSHPAALLARCEKKCPPELKRRAGESGEAFLLRISTEENRETLAALAEKVELSFYSDKPQSVSRELYKSVKRLKFNV